MKKIIFLLTLIIGLGNLAVVNQVNASADDLLRYYEHPVPQEILPELKNYYADRFAISNLVGTAALFGKLFEVSGLKPEEIEKYIIFSELDDNRKAHFLLAYKFAGKDYKDRLESLLDTVPEKKTRKSLKNFLDGYVSIDELVEKLNDKNLKIPVSEPNTWADASDALWSNFFVTGDTKYVEALIHLFNTLLTNSSGNKMVAAANMGAIDWSLKANAIHHQRVYDFVKSEAANENEYASLTIQMLQKVVSVADQKRIKQQSTSQSSGKLK